MTISQRIAAGQWPSSDPYPWAPAQTNLEAVWDAGNTASYSGSGNWNSLVAAPASGAAQSAYSMTPGSVSGATPTFNGTAGRRSRGEHLDKVGSAFFKQTTPTTFWRNQATTAAADCTIATILYIPDQTGAGSGLMAFGSDQGSIVSGSQYAFVDFRSGTKYFNWDGANTTQRNSFYSPVGSFDVRGGPYFIAWSIKANATSFFYCNGAYVGTPSTFTVVGATPGTSYPMMMMSWSSANGTSGYQENAGSRYHLTAMWNRQLSKEELDFAYTNLLSAGRIA